ncbi:MAG TPA: NADH-ubiquinone oxidoreductase-F iron-sulfur binding region domain-containing protein [Candidatus Binataceae bacterium]|jgi:formate dehydrogenase iron-sulfur subunit|nr:NADH-ubiquinone oxidoreductase-F iron-sulfur binding region domain-containing protein [Candidatus Binataceae bacterium]
MKATVYVPRDSGALSLGAEHVARAIAQEAARRRIDLTLVRNGSRGLYWLEPMVEAATQRGRVAYGPVRPESVAALFDAGFIEGQGHELCLGLTEEIAWLKNQERLTFARVGVIDPVSLDDYVEHGGYEGLRRAAELNATQIADEVVESGLRGRGGAGFPCGIKLHTAMQTASDQKYVVCNADEGDSGTFADRMIMEGDPFVLIEGMTIAAICAGADRGYIYLRSEYPHSARTLAEAIAAARARGYLGPNILSTRKRFELEVRIGAGSYICGEETAMLESLEGKRGMVRYKPPVPAISGLFGKPTVINNVLTLATLPIILARGGAFYKNYGVGRSRGTQPIQLAGNVKRPGLIEKAFGVTLRDIVYDYGGGTASGRPLRAVQVGGPLGAYFPESMLDVALDYEELAARNGLLGHGGVVVFDDTVNMAEMARYAMEFCALESCGKCTPCRIGSTRGVEVIDRILARQDQPGNLALLRDLCDTLTNASLCALGGLTPLPVLSALKYFPRDFGLGDDASGLH